MSRTGCLIRESRESTPIELAQLRERVRSSSFSLHNYHKSKLKLELKTEPPL